MQKAGRCFYCRSAITKMQGIILAIIIIIALIVGVGVYYATLPKQITPTKEILIGGTLPLTGRYSEDGVWHYKVYQLWQEEVNAKGGILGRPVRMIIYDDKSDATTAVSLYERLITVDKVDILLGGYPSGTIGPVSTIAEQYKKIMLTAGACTSSLYQRGYKYIFSTLAVPDYAHAKTFFDWIKTLPENMKPKTMALIYPDYIWSKAVANGAKYYANEIGIEIVFEEAYPMDIKDFTPLLTRLIEKTPDVIFDPTFLSLAVMEVRTLNELGYIPKAYWIGVAPWHPSFPKMLGSLAEGIMTTCHWHPDAPYPGSKDFAKRFYERWGDKAWDYCGAAYAALQVIEKAITATGTLDNEVLRDYIATHDFETVLGTINFKPYKDPWGGTIEGLAWKEGLLTQIQNGENVIVFPPELATNKPIYPMK
jgi:branched-chain amino acid transport system substrate-binding protein